MGSSSSKSPRSSYSRKTGAVYTKKLYFDPEADSSKGDSYWITAAELREKLSELVDIKERIINVRYYKHPLRDWQASDILLHHAFIVFETDTWWWSIEKNSEGVTIQRSQYFRSVMEYRRKKRSGKDVALVKRKSGNTTMRELIHHLWDGKYLTYEYSFNYENCQRFAELIYQFIETGKPGRTAEDAYHEACWYFDL